MGTKNALKVSGGSLKATNVHVGDRVTVRVGKGGKRPTSYPEGCIGSNLKKRNYVKYLVERYHRYRDGGFQFWPDRTLSLFSAVQEH